MKRLILVACAVLGVFILWKTQQKTTPEMMRVGVTSGPHADIMRNIQSRTGLPLHIVEFSDFVLPNMALQSGEIDVNCYQHEPYLETQNKERGWSLVSVGTTILLPMGVYSTRHTSLKDLNDGAIVSIPSDPTNGGRALLILQKAGLLKLNPDHKFPTLLSITDNPKKLSIKEIEAPMQPRSLADVDIAVINTDWVLVSGMDPDSAIFKEDKESPYTNILVARKETLEKAQKLRKVYQTEETKAFIIKTFKGAVVPGW